MGMYKHYIIYKIILYKVTTLIVTTYVQMTRLIASDNIALYGL